MVHKAHGGNGGRNTDQSARVLVGGGWLQLLSSNLRANKRKGEKVGKAGSGTRSGNAMNTCEEKRASGNGKMFPFAEGEVIGRILWVGGRGGDFETHGTLQTKCTAISVPFAFLFGDGGVVLRRHLLRFDNRHGQSTANPKCPIHVCDCIAYGVCKPSRRPSR